MTARDETLLRNVRGTASAEVAVALPVLVIVLAGVLFMFRQASEHHASMRRARACAWDYVLHACNEGAAPLCAGAHPDTGAELPGADRGSFDDIAEIPLIGPALEGLVGKTAGASSSWSTSAFMAPDKQVAGDTVRTLVCAPPAEPLGSRIKDALCDMIQNKLEIPLLGC